MTNYCLYCTKVADPRLLLKAGLSIGKTSLGAGIHDMPFGTVYIAPLSWLSLWCRENKINPSKIKPKQIQQAIISYYWNE